MSKKDKRKGRVGKAKRRRIAKRIDNEIEV
jgi:hypothetical protein